MQIGIDYSLERVEVEVREDCLVPVARDRAAPALADPCAALRSTLETPYDFPALRQALTPDDHVAVVVDEYLPSLASFLTATLEHITSAGVAPEAITLICPPPVTPQAWLEDLPEAFEDVQIETHDPSNRKKLSYLATTRAGRRLYLNRTLVDADQIVVLGRRHYDPLLGYAGAEGALFPALSDEATIKELNQRLSLAAPLNGPSPLQREAGEVAWLLGAPFFIQVIESAREQFAHVLAGVQESSREAERLLDERWQVTVSRPAELVIASISGEPSRVRFDDLARALACAARVVKPKGRIVLLSQAHPELTAEGQLLRDAESPQQALSVLQRQSPLQRAAAFQWASAAEQASIYLLSGLEDETVEELFAAPLENARQIQRLLDASGSCALLEDAHKLMAVVEDEE